MSLYRIAGRGSWILERTVGGVWLRRSTGTKDRTLAAKMEALVVELGTHRPDLIRAAQEQQIGLLELYHAVKRHGYSYQVTPDRALLVAPAVTRWLKRVELAEKTKADYRQAFALLARVHRRPLVLADLPAVLTRYARIAKPVMFVRVKAAVQSFVRDTVPKGRYSDLWRDVSSVRGRKPRRRRVQGGLPPETCRLVAERLAQQYGAAHGAVWWTLYTTGMGKRECWGREGRRLRWWELWEVLPDQIIIHGTKREARERVVPRLATPVRPTMRSRAFNAALTDVGQQLGIPRLTIYVARRSYALLLEKAGLEDSECDALMGHAPKGDRGKYREHDLGPYLAGIAEKVRTVLGPEPRYLQAMS